MKSFPSPSDKLVHQVFPALFRCFDSDFDVLNQKRIDLNSSDEALKPSGESYLSVAQLIKKHQDVLNELKHELFYQLNFAIKI
jgi:hypothetical protein